MKFLDNNSLSNFLEQRTERLFVYPLVDDTKMHWTQSKLIGVYFCGFKSLREFYINYGHYDLGENELIVGRNFAKYDDVVYRSKILDVGTDAEILKWVWLNKHIEKYEYNNLTPLYQIFDHCREVFEGIKILEGYISNDTTEKYNLLLRQLVKIEKNGLYTESGYEYTEYNPFTLTGRPSNKFNHINYAALNNTNGTRERFVSRFEKGWLAEFDFHAYHVHLIAMMMKFKFDNPSDVYGELSKLMNLPRELVKTEVFHQIYGGVKPEYKQITFFKNLDALFKNIARNHDDSYSSILFKKPMPLAESYMKAVNYLIQNLETEINSIILGEINSFLETKQTKLILYTYDSFLFDYCPEDTPKIFFQIKEILEKFNVPTKFKIGRDYHTMFEKHL